MRELIRRARPWLALAGVAAAAVVLLPPVGTAARQYEFAQAVQYAVLAVAAPALVVTGAPWRHVASRLAARLAFARSRKPAARRAWAVLVGYLVVALGWRLPACVGALVRYPVLTVAEAVTLIAAGCALWLELVESPPLLPRVSRPQRAALAALPMWAMWASAYIMGFSRVAWFAALAHPRGLGVVADQQIAVAVLWAIPGLCFVPVIFASLITWLRDSADPDDELRSVPGAARTARTAQAVTPRPPRGWRLPSG